MQLQLQDKKLYLPHNMCTMSSSIYWKRKQGLGQKIFHSQAHNYETPWFQNRARQRQQQTRQGYQGLRPGETFLPSLTFWSNCLSPCTDHRSCQGRRAQHENWSERDILRHIGCLKWDFINLPEDSTTKKEGLKSRISTTVLWFKFLNYFYLQFLLHNHFGCFILFTEKI